MTEGGVDLKAAVITSVHLAKGPLLTAMGVELFRMGSAIQNAVIETREVYDQFVSAYSKNFADFLITSGHDVGGGLMALGVYDFLNQSIEVGVKAHRLSRKEAKAINHYLRAGVMGFSLSFALMELIEINFTTAGIGTPQDLLIMALPGFLMIPGFIKNIIERKNDLAQLEVKSKE